MWTNSEYDSCIVKIVCVFKCTEYRCLYAPVYTSSFVLSIFFKSRVAVKYSERHQVDIIEVYEKVKMVAKMAAKMGCFLKKWSVLK